MFRQSPRYNQRNKGLKVKHVLQISLLLGVCIWLIYQVQHSHNRRVKEGTNTLENETEKIKFGRKDLQRGTERTITNKDRLKEDQEEEEESRVEDGQHDQREGEHGVDPVEGEKEMEDGQENRTIHEEKESSGASEELKEKEIGEKEISENGKDSEITGVGEQSKEDSSGDDSEQNKEENLYKIDEKNISEGKEEKKVAAIEETQGKESQTEQREEKDVAVENGETKGEESQDSSQENESENKGSEEKEIRVEQNSKVKAMESDESRKESSTEEGEKSKESGDVETSGHHNSGENASSEVVWETQNLIDTGAVYLEQAKSEDSSENKEQDRLAERNDASNGEVADGHRIGTGLSGAEIDTSQTNNSKQAISIEQKTTESNSSEKDDGSNASATGISKSEEQQLGSGNSVNSDGETDHSYLGGGEGGNSAGSFHNRDELTDSNLYNMDNTRVIPKETAANVGNEANDRKSDSNQGSATNENKDLADVGATDSSNKTESVPEDKTSINSDTTFETEIKSENYTKSDAAGGVHSMELQNASLQSQYGTEKKFDGSTGNNGYANVQQSYPNNEIQAAEESSNTTSTSPNDEIQVAEESSSTTSTNPNNEIQVAEASSHTTSTNPNNEMQAAEEGGKTTSTNDTAEPLQSQTTSGSSGSSVSQDHNEVNYENTDEGRHHGVHSPDSSIPQEVKDARTDLETLPDAGTGRNNQNDAVAK